MATIQGDLGTNLTSVWLTDSSGLTTDLVTATGNDLTNTGVALTTGVQGDAGDFELADSTDELSRTEANLGGSLDFGSNDFTIAMWVKLESSPATGVKFVLASQIGSDAGFHFQIRDDGGTEKLQFLTGNGSSFNAATITQTLTTGTDYHLAVTKSSTTVTMYVDGSSIGTGSGAATVSDSADDFVIGNESGGGDAFDGIINQVCIWNGTALSGANITTLYNSGSGIEYAAPASVAADNALTMCNF